MFRAIPRFAFGSWQALKYTKSTYMKCCAVLKLRNIFIFSVSVNDCSLNLSDIKFSYAASRQTKHSNRDYFPVIFLEKVGVHKNLQLVEASDCVKWKTTVCKVRQTLGEASSKVWKDERLKFVVTLDHRLDHFVVRLGINCVSISTEVRLYGESYNFTMPKFNAESFCDHFVNNCALCLQNLSSTSTPLKMFHFYSNSYENETT